MRISTSLAPVIGAAAMLMLTTACASSGHTVPRADVSRGEMRVSSRTIEAAGPRPSRDSDMLTGAEASAVLGKSPTAYDAVAQMRQRWLSQRSTSGAIGRHRPSVFVNGAFSGEVDALRMIPLSDVATFQFVRPADAILWYGADHRAGVILVRLAR